MSIRASLRAGGLAALWLVAGVSSSQAASLEDIFRDYLNRLRSSGQVLRESPMALGQIEIVRPVLEPRVDQLPVGRDRYAIFVAPGCRTCSVAIERMRALGFDKVEVLDIARSSVAREAFQLAQGRGVPTILVSNYRLSGYSDKLFKQAVVQESVDYGNRMKGEGS